MRVRRRTCVLRRGLIVRVAPAPGAPIRKGSAAPEFVAQDLEGNTLALRAYRGRVVLLDFWSTFYDPCKEEFPHIQELYRANRSRGLEVIAVSMDDADESAEVAAIARHFALEFPVVHDRDSQIARAYDPQRRAPLVVVVGRAGDVAAVREGYSPGDEEDLAREVDAVLSAETPPSSRRRR